MSKLDPLEWLRDQAHAEQTDDEPVYGHASEALDEFTRLKSELAEAAEQLEAAMKCVGLYKQVGASESITLRRVQLQDELRIALAELDRVRGTV